MEETPVKETPAAAPVTDTPIEAPPEKDPPKKKSDKKALILLLLLLFIGVGVGVYFAFFREKPDDNRIPYAEGVVLLEGDVVEPAEVGWINLRYNRKAFSSDGVHFTCLLANDAGNALDMYFDVYADSGLEEEVFLSGLIPPGYALKVIELSRALPAGTTICYVVHNQVDVDEDGNQVIARQMITTIEFVVNSAPSP